MPERESDGEKKRKHLLRLIANDERGELDVVFERDYKEEENPDEIKIGVNKCPTIVRAFECIAHGYGEGVHATEDALKAFKADCDAKLAKALRAAQVWGNKNVCPPPCKDHGFIQFQFSNTQEWEHDIHANPVKAYTWEVVGYLIVKFCS